jgi:hypothetical protein
MKNVDQTNRVSLLDLKVILPNKCCHDQCDRARQTVIRPAAL